MQSLPELHLTLWVLKVLCVFNFQCLKLSHLPFSYILYINIHLGDVSSALITHFTSKEIKRFSEKIEAFYLVPL